MLALLAPDYLERQRALPGPGLDQLSLAEARALMREMQNATCPPVRAQRNDRLSTDSPYVDSAAGSHGVKPV